MKLQNGHKYTIELNLGFFEQIATNDIIKGKFEENGFTEINMDGSGHQRFMQGTWNNPDVEFPTDVHMVYVKDDTDDKILLQN